MYAPNKPMGSANIGFEKENIHVFVHVLEYLEIVTLIEHDLLQVHVRVKIWL